MLIALQKPLTFSSPCDTARVQSCYCLYGDEQPNGSPGENCDEIKWIWADIQQCDVAYPSVWCTQKTNSFYHHKKTCDIYRKPNNKQKLAGWILFITSKVSCCVGSMSKILRGCAATLATCVGTKCEPPKKIINHSLLWHSALAAGTVASQQEICGFVSCVEPGRMFAWIYSKKPNNPGGEEAPNWLMVWIWASGSVCDPHDKLRTSAGFYYFLET